MAPHVANIGPGGQRRRLVLGVAMLAVGAAVVTLLIALGTAPGWLLLAFLPFWVGALGLIQAREKT